MIAKGLLLFCLVGLSCATFLSKRQLTSVQPLHTLQLPAVVQHLPTVQHTLYRQAAPEVHEYLAQPVFHKVHQQVHVEKYIQPVVHHIYRQPQIKQTVESPVVQAVPAVAAVPQERVFQPAQIISGNVQSQAQAQAHIAV